MSISPDGYEIGDNSKWSHARTPPIGSLYVTGDAV
jgi:hypothetical protein